jgi:hypothetical protein
MAAERIQRRSRKPTEQVEETKVHVSVAPPGADSKHKEEVLEVRKFVTEPAYVRVSAGVTRSTGNYESMRIDVAISMPCYAEQVDDTVAAVSDMVAARLDVEIDAYLGEGD